MNRFAETVAGSAYNGTAPSLLVLVGAACFGVIVGWNVCYINRHRSDRVGITDVGALFAAIGGGACLALFPAKSDLFAMYSIGLCIGFFGYLLVILTAVIRSEKFNVDFFLDGRVPKPKPTEELSSQRPLSGALIAQEENPDYTTN